MSSKINTRDEDGKEKPVTLSQQVGQKILKVFTDNHEFHRRWADFFEWKKIVDAFMLGNQQRLDEYKTVADQIKTAILDENKAREVHRKRLNKSLRWGAIVFGTFEAVANLEKICHMFKWFFGHFI